MAVFVANVGVNAAHAARGLESPLFADDTFRLVPIPETVAWAPPMLRLADVGDLAMHTPPRWHCQGVHYDPDLSSLHPSYGDNCRTAGRAYSLRRATAGDLIVFLARLRPAAGPKGFYLVGRLPIAEILADLLADPGPGWWDCNAHVRRARATGSWSGFWVFRGQAGSGLLARAIEFRREEADRAFRGTWRWRTHRTELQTIGSNTRAVRRLTGPAEAYLRRLAA